VLNVEDWAEIRRLHRAEVMPIKVQKSGQGLTFYGNVTCGQMSNLRVGSAGWIGATGVRTRRPAPDDEGTW